MEDNRFIELPVVDYDKVTDDFRWLADQEDYFTDELIGIYSSELDTLIDTTRVAFELYSQATSEIIKSNQLHLLDIPDYFHELIAYTWDHREGKHPFLFGRFDVNGGLNGQHAKVIEFNADTCTMVPETFFWHPIHLEHEGSGLKGFNHLHTDIYTKLSKIKNDLNVPNPVILGTSLGHPEDVSNVKAVINTLATHQDCFIHYEDLEHITFSEDGVFIDAGDGFIPVDIMVKLFPWDWAYKEEPELAKTLSDLIMQGKVTVISPPYTTIWQNKKFLNYITKHFPNDVIAKSYDHRPDPDTTYVVKSSFGRLGEEVTIQSSKDIYKNIRHDKHSYQEYLKLPKDSDGYYYQLGMFYTDKPSALNIRGKEGKIIDDDCEFFCHFLMK